MRDSSIRNERGFALVELAIVLVIIGLVLGAVIKGRDVLNSAKQKKFYTNFVKGWELVVTSYYDRTGQLLGDGQANGGSQENADGKFDGTSIFYTVNVIKAVGLTPVAGNTQLPPVFFGSAGVNAPGVYTYSGAYSGAQTIWLSVSCVESKREHKKYNTLFFMSIPTDLAIAMDTMIDGQADSKTGVWRQLDDSVDWPDASTHDTVTAIYILDL